MYVPSESAFMGNIRTGTLITANNWWHQHKQSIILIHTQHRYHVPVYWWTTTSEMIVDFVLTVWILTTEVERHIGGKIINFIITTVFHILCFSCIYILWSVGAAMTSCKSQMNLFCFFLLIIMYKDCFCLCLTGKQLARGRHIYQLLHRDQPQWLLGTTTENKQVGERQTEKESWAREKRGKREWEVSNWEDDKQSKNKAKMIKRAKREKTERRTDVATWSGTSQTIPPSHPPGRHGQPLTGISFPKLPLPLDNETAPLKHM